MLGSLIPAKFRAALYYLGTLVTGVLGIALVFGAITSKDADSVTQAVTGLLALLGGTAPTALAAIKTTQQISNGTLAPSAVQTTVQGLQQVNAEFGNLTSAVTTGLAQVQAQAAAVLGNVGVVPSPLVQQFLGQPDVAATAPARP